MNQDLSHKRLTQGDNMNKEWNKKLKIKELKKRINTLHTILSNLEDQLQTLKREEQVSNIKDFLKKQEKVIEEV